MIDATTRKTIQVLSAGTAGSYIDVSRDHLDKVCKSITNYNIPYWVGQLAISVDRQPMMMEINLGKKVDPHQVQTLLDAAA